MAVPSLHGVTRLLSSVTLLSICAHISALTFV
jgi:hypothetical protein